jgi:ATP-dependent DNA helicase Rep
LNPAQREAVAYDAAPLLVLAGAGSGKTRVITAKIAHLVARDVAPERIVAITFTNKAAREMRERAQAALKRASAADAAAKIAVSTFHAYGLSIVRAEARALGIRPSFSILDPADIEPIVAELAATVDRARARAIQWKISQWKNALIAPCRSAWRCRGRQRTCGSARLCGLRGRACRVPGGRLRRPDRVAGGAVRSRCRRA